MCGKGTFSQIRSHIYIYIKLKSCPSVCMSCIPWHPTIILPSFYLTFLITTFFWLQFFCCFNNLFSYITFSVIASVQSPDQIPVKTLCFFLCFYLTLLMKTLFFILLPTFLATIFVVASTTCFCYITFFGYTFFWYM